jgi:hypothetical protein
VAAQRPNFLECYKHRQSVRVVKESDEACQVFLECYKHRQSVRVVKESDEACQVFLECYKHRQSVRVVKESDSKSDGFARTGSNPVVVAIFFCNFLQFFYPFLFFLTPPHCKLLSFVAECLGQALWHIGEVISPQRQTSRVICT